MSQTGSQNAVPRSDHSAAAAAEYTQEQAAEGLPEQCLLQLVLSLTAPYLCAWCPQELKHTLPAHMLRFWEHPRELLQVLWRGFLWADEFRA